MDLLQTHAYHRIYHHLIWSTKRREPLLTPLIEMVVHSFLIDKAKSLGTEMLAINGMEDHVHLLVRLAPKQNISKFVKDLKGSSSHFLNEVFEGHGVESVIVFQWQPGYAVFSVGEKDLPIVRSYIRRQKEHHRKKRIAEEWELTSRQRLRK
jgi:putative transposase